MRLYIKELGKKVANSPYRESRRECFQVGDIEHCCQSSRRLCDTPQHSCRGALSPGTGTLMCSTPQLSVSSEPEHAGGKSNKSLGNLTRFGINQRIDKSGTATSESF